MSNEIALIEINLHQGNVSSREIRAGDVTVYADITLHTLWIEDYPSLEAAQQVAEDLIPKYQRIEDLQDQVREIMDEIAEAVA